MADSLYRYAQPAPPQTNVLVRLRQSIEPETQTQISVLRRWAFIGALTGILLSFSRFKVTPCSICTHSQINTDNTAETDLGPGALIAPLANGPQTQSRRRQGITQSVHSHDSLYR